MFLVATIQVQVSLKKLARRNGLTDVASVYFEDFDRPEFMSTSEKVACKIVYDTKTLKLVGAQIGSWGNAIHTETIFMLALVYPKRINTSWNCSYWCLLLATLQQAI